MTENKSYSHLYSVKLKVVQKLLRIKVGINSFTSAWGTWFDWRTHGRLHIPRIRLMCIAHTHAHTATVAINTSYRRNSNRIELSCPLASGATFDNDVSKLRSISKRNCLANNVCHRINKAVIRSITFNEESLLKMTFISLYLWMSAKGLIFVALSTRRSIVFTTQKSVLLTK